MWFKISLLVYSLVIFQAYFPVLAARLTATDQDVENKNYLELAKNVLSEIDGINKKIKDVAGVIQGRSNKYKEFDISPCKCTCRCAENDLKDQLSEQMDNVQSKLHSLKSGLYAAGEIIKTKFQQLTHHM